MYHHLVLQWVYTGHQPVSETERRYMEAARIVLNSLPQADRAVIDFVYAKPNGYPVGRLCDLSDIQPSLTVGKTKPLLTGVWEQIEKEYIRNV